MAEPTAEPTIENGVDQQTLESLREIDTNTTRNEILTEFKPQQVEGAEYKELKAQFDKLSREFNVAYAECSEKIEGITKKIVEKIADELKCTGDNLAEAKLISLPTGSPKMELALAGLGNEKGNGLLSALKPLYEENDKMSKPLGVIFHKAWCIKDELAQQNIPDSGRVDAIDAMNRKLAVLRSKIFLPQLITAAESNFDREAMINTRFRESYNAAAERGIVALSILENALAAGADDFVQEYADDLRSLHSRVKNPDKPRIERLMERTGISENQ